MLPYILICKHQWLTQKCRMTLDESPYYNPMRFLSVWNNRSRCPVRKLFGSLKQGEKNLLSRLQPGYESAKTFTKIYEQR